MGRSLERTPVAADQAPHLRLYRRLWLSRIDLEEAKSTIAEIVVRRLPYPRSRGPSSLLQALTTSLVVSYARPFVNARGQSAVAERTIPGSLLRVYSSAERAFHERLLEMRNREAAHSDADILEMYIEVFPDGDGGICRVSRNPLRRVELRALERMIEKLEGEIERRCDELRLRLPQHVWL
jgi:hypothetical protein